MLYPSPHITSSSHSPPPSPTTLSSFYMHKADWDPINQSINAIKWEKEIESRNMNDFSHFLIHATMDCVNPHCPKFKNKPGSNKNKIPRDRRILFRQRKRKKRLLQYLPRFSRRRKDIEKTIVEIEEKLVTSYKKQNATEEELAINNIKTNPKHFYSFARKKQVTKGSIGPLKIDNKLITDPPEICNILANQYASMFSKPDESNPKIIPSTFFSLSNSPLPCLLDINFTVQDIENEIDNLRSNAAPGPDHLPVMLLKSCKK